MTILCKSSSRVAADPRIAPRPVDMLVSAARFCQPRLAAFGLSGLFFCFALLSANLLPANLSPAWADPIDVPAGAASQSAFATDWTAQAGGAAHMRLISQSFARGRYVAAVEIKLQPSAITYWREPGEAGVPPEFSFAGSENLASAEPLYPAPQRLDEGGLEAFGYRGGTVFPIHVRPVDPAKPVRLAVTLNYAVCDRICIPAKGEAQLTLPLQGVGPDDATIAAAEAKVPVALQPADVATHVTIHAESGQAKPQWALQWQGPGDATDLFAEGPRGWSFETKKTGPNSFRLTAVDRPSAAAANVPVRLTVVSGDKAHEISLPLDLGQPSH